MNFYCLTLFPEIIDSVVNKSILGRAIKEKIINVKCINIRDFSNNKHNQVDDYPYGGGAGMVIMAEPVFKAYEHAKSIINTNTSRYINDSPKTIYLTPSGEQYNQKTAKTLSKESNLILICGHYEGIDQRVIDETKAMEVSIGDYVITGGELAALIIIESCARLVEGVLNKRESFENESFENNLLEYPQYTRPFEFQGRNVPEILLSGNHKNIERWRREQSLLKTYRVRPDLLQGSELSKKDIECIDKSID